MSFSSISSTTFAPAHLPAGHSDAFYIADTIALRDGRLALLYVDLIPEPEPWAGAGASITLQLVAAPEEGGAAGPPVTVAPPASVPNAPLSSEDPGSTPIVYSGAHVVELSDGRLFVAWSQTLPEQWADSLHGQLLSADGAPIGEATLLKDEIRNVLFSQSIRDIDATAEGGFALAITEDDIFQFRLPAAGLLMAFDVDAAGVVTEGPALAAPFSVPGGSYITDTRPDGTLAVIETRDFTPYFPIYDPHALLSIIDPETGVEILPPARIADAPMPSDVTALADGGLLTTSRDYASFGTPSGTSSFVDLFTKYDAAGEAVFQAELSEPALEAAIMALPALEAAFEEARAQGRDVPGVEDWGNAAFLEISRGDVSALPDGGFVVTYDGEVRYPTSPVSGSLISYADFVSVTEVVVLQRFDAGGVQWGDVGGDAVYVVDAPGIAEGSNPHLAFPDAPGIPDMGATVHIVWPQMAEIALETLFAVPLGTDGDDRLVAAELLPETVNSTADIELGGRGGADTLIGGPGDDRLYGDDNPPAYRAVESDDLAIYRVYLATLGRAPDPSGYLHWQEALEAGRFTLPEIVARFIGSPEFEATYGALADAEFLALLYVTVLDRAAEPEEIEAWSALMESGLARAEVVIGFSQSPEFRALTQEAAAAFHLSASDADLMPDWNTDLNGAVFRLYETTLARAPDTAGLEGWVAALEAGTPLAQVASGFIESAEFEATYGALADAEFLALLYVNVLGRVGRADEIEAWLALMERGEGGLSRAEVVIGFSQSPEFAAALAAPFGAWMRATMDQSQADRLEGGPGDDLLTGGAGPDVFVFAPETGGGGGGGADVILDFELWDQLDLTAFGFADVTEARGHLSPSGPDLVFAHGGQTVTLLETGLEDLGDGVFLI